MDREEFGRHYHSLVFKNACHERKGSAFQTFFEEIMVKHDASFVAVKPSGKEGDWKCDGFSQATGTVYQCYSPEEMTNTKAAAKIKEDFDGARIYWTEEMKCWTFVWSAHDRLPPQATKKLQEVRNGDHGVTIEDWNRERLWRIVKALQEGVRSELLGPVLEPSSASDTTIAEIKPLLTYLAARKFNPDTENLDTTDIALKLEKNNLSASVCALVTPAIPVAKMVDRYLERHPDAEYSIRISQALVQEYNRLKHEAESKDETIDPDYVFWQIVRYASSGDISTPGRFWAAWGIVSYYFELCDIFEK